MLTSLGKDPIDEEQKKIEKCEQPMVSGNGQYESLDDEPKLFLPKSGHWQSLPCLF